MKIKLPRLPTKLKWFNSLGLSMAIFNGGNAVNGVISRSYIFAGLSFGIGIIWIGLIGINDKYGRF